MSASLQMTPRSLLGLIDASKLDRESEHLYRGMVAFEDSLTIWNLSFCNTDNYNLRFSGLASPNNYFSFTQSAGHVLISLLFPFGNDVLKIVEPEGFTKLKQDVADLGFGMTLPLIWEYARQLNLGLYEDAKRFGIEPPCLKVSSSCKLDESFLLSVPKIVSVSNTVCDYIVLANRN